MTLLRLSFGAAMVASVGMIACTANTGNATGPPPEDLTSAPSCAPGTFELSGVVESEDRTSTAPVGNYGFANVGNPSTLSTQFGLGGSLELQWSGTIPNGTTAPATGSLTLPATATGAGPEVYCVGAGSEIEPFAWGGKFLLTGLRHATTADACSAAPAALMPASGELLGCYGFKSQ